MFFNLSPPKGSNSNLSLLKKVEELTLHLIEKDRQLRQVTDRLDQLEAK